MYALLVAEKRSFFVTLCEAKVPIYRAQTAFRGRVTHNSPRSDLRYPLADDGKTILLWHTSFHEGCSAINRARVATIPCVSTAIKRFGVVGNGTCSHRLLTTTTRGCRYAGEMHQGNYCYFSAAIEHKVVRSERKRSAGIWTFPIEEEKTILTLLAFHRLLTVAKASNEMIAVNEMLLCYQIIHA